MVSPSERSAGTSIASKAGGGGTGGRVGDEKGKGDLSRRIGYGLERGRLCEIGSPLEASTPVTARYPCKCEVIPGRDMQGSK